VPPVLGAGMDMALALQSPLDWSDMDRQKIASRLIASYLQKEKGQSLFFQRERSVASLHPCVVSSVVSNGS
jgi:hypothetical protein